MAKPSAPAALRNCEPIFEVVQKEFRNCKSVLEIGSGTGQHAVFFGSRMPWLDWQTSDLKANHEAIASWLNDAQLTNVQFPVELDVCNPGAFNKTFDAAFSANTAHIMSIDEVECMFGFVADHLEPGGRFCLYGPFNLHGNYTSDSNRQFDASLKAKDSAMGIRDVDKLDEFADARGLSRKNIYAMPANNMIIVWHNLTPGDSGLGQ